MYRYFRYNISILFVFLSLIQCVFPARTVPPTSLPELPVNFSKNDTWHYFSKFTDAGKGANLSGMSVLKKYFHQFGYIDNLENFTDTFDDNIETAVINYQINLGLRVTGKLDSWTVNQIMSPRCGVSDDINKTYNHVHLSKKYAFFNGDPRWAPRTLTYAFSDSHMIDYLSFSDIKDVFQRSFSRWASIIPLNFRESSNYSKADIKIAFYDGDHGDGQPFDGLLGVLAHSSSPENGRIHLDKGETWAIDVKSSGSNVAIDLESVATHEIGHILGLAHSSVKEAVMYPSLATRTKRVDIKMDDVKGIQMLYGSNPNFRYTPSKESDISSGYRPGKGRWVKWVALLGVTWGLLF